MANNVCWYDHVLRSEDGDILRRALNFEVEGQSKKGRLKGTLKKQVGEEGVFEKGRFSWTIKVECWHKSDCCWAELNLATLTCWGYYQSLNTGVSLSIHH